MKVSIFLTLVFVVVDSLLNAQNANAPIQIPAPNTNCDAALILCSEKQTIRTEFKDDPTCNAGKTVLYFYYKASETNSGGSSLSNVFFNTVVGVSNSTQVLSSFKAFGPFLNTGEGCRSINGMLGSPIASSTSSSFSHSVNHSIVMNRIYILKITVESCSGFISVTPNSQTLKCSVPEVKPCLDCITGFRPPIGKYIVSGWVKDKSAPGSSITFTSPKIRVSSTGVPTKTLLAKGEIIDGWQRIEDVFEITQDSDFNLELICSTGECFFDDIRVFPFDGSMMSYVYDPLTLRLVAELDERNYAKIYEYDEEGKLIRVKKETEKGIMTIQENRENSSGRP